MRLLAKHLNKLAECAVTLHSLEEDARYYNAVLRELIKAKRLTKKNQRYVYTALQSVRTHGNLTMGFVASQLIRELLPETAKFEANMAARNTK